MIKLIKLPVLTLFIFITLGITAFANWCDGWNNIGETEKIYKKEVAQ